MDNASESIFKKHPALAQAQEKVERMMAGAYCLHASWGFGKIQHYDAVLDRFVLDFEEGPKNHLMDPEFCVRKLEVLDEQHLLVRFQQDSEGLKKQIKEDPIGLILQMMRENQQTQILASEIERHFRPIIGVSAYRSWWNRTQKLMAEDGRIRPVEGKPNTFALCEEPLDAVTDLLRQFDLHREAMGKISVLEKILQLSEEHRLGLIDHIPVFVEALQAAITGDSPLPIAKRLQACFLRDHLFQIQGETADFVEPSAKSILLEAGNHLSPLAEALVPRYSAQFLNLVACAYPDEWEERCAQLLRNGSEKFISDCVAFFMERGCADVVAAYFLRWLREHTLKAPVLHWILKNRHARRFADVIDGQLIGVALLRAIFRAVDMEAVHLSGNKRIPLAELLSKDYNLIPDLLADASAEEARDLAQMLWTSQGFNALTKKSLLARFIKLFPQVQSLVMKDVQKDVEEQETLKVSQESLEAKRREYEDLLSRRIPENKRAIQVAKEEGDLRENSEYKMARQDQETLLALRAQLEKDLARAQVIHFEEADADGISIGSTVTLRHRDTKRTETFSILGAWDGNPDRNILSYRSPLGKDLMGKKLGQTVLRANDQEIDEWIIESIGRWVDQEKP
ncbi:MAG: GreA/GreB family elongation factor [Puniceicoccales bacterium]|jgi:transcription elongation GreA/GreB family factor|nr:GreA/GreB family elongation factor [Puniceicoccales bacterium]